MSISSSLRAGFRAVSAVNRIGLFAASAAVAVMMLFIVLDVAGRNFGFRIVRNSYEFSEYYFMAMGVFPALGYIYTTGILPKVDSLYQRYSRKIRIVVVCLIILIEIIIFGLLSYWSFFEFLGDLQGASVFVAGSSTYPIWPVMLAVFSGLFLVFCDRVLVLMENLVFRNGTLIAHEIRPESERIPEDDHAEE